MNIEDETYIIFSVDNDPIRDAKFESWCDKKNIGYKKLQGCYKGEEETSYIVNDKHRKKILNKNWLINQTCFLFLGNLKNGYRSCWEVYGKGTVAKYIGKFKPETKEYALKQDSWTFDPTQGFGGQYFIVEN